MFLCDLIFNCFTRALIFNYFYSVLIPLLIFTCLLSSSLIFIIILMRTTLMSLKIIHFIQIPHYFRFFLQIRLPLQTTPIVDFLVFLLLFLKLP